jgi:Rrf2 family protein
LKGQVIGLKISAKSRYALHLMLELAMQEPGVNLSVKSVAEVHGISEKYLEQIIPVLVRGGFVRSVRGARGGYHLVREPEDVLQSFALKYAELFSKKTIKKQDSGKILLASKEKIVYACLSLRPKHMEELMEETGISLPELTNLLFDMEMKHYIKQPLKNYFIIQS